MCAGVGIHKVRNGVKRNSKNSTSVTELFQTDQEEPKLRLCSHAMPCNDWVVHTTTSGNIYIYIHRVYGAYLVQFTAGMAYPLARACSNRLYKSSPVTTPAGTISLKDAMILSCLYDDNNIEVQIGLELFIQHTRTQSFFKRGETKKALFCWLR